MIRFWNDLEDGTDVGCGTSVITIIINIGYDDDVVKFMSLDVG